MILNNMNVKEYDAHLADRMYQILTGNSNKPLRSLNFYSLLLAVQGLYQFEELRRPDINIDEECDYGAFTK